MALRFDLSRPIQAAALLVALAANLHAQLPGGLGGLGGQEPAAVAPPRSPAEKLEDLKREIERLKGEIQFVQQRAALGAAPIKDRLQNRVFAPRSIDAGQSSAAMPAPAIPVTPQPARRMTSDEQQKYQGDVMMVCQGRAIRTADFQALVDYLGTVKDAGDLTSREQRTALELIRLEAVLGSFEESSLEAKQQIDAAKKELDEGKAWTEVQNRYGRGPNMAQEGKIQVARYSPLGLEVEKAAFTTAKGKVVGPVRGATGYAILAIDGLTKTDTDAGDMVDARLIFVPYHGDPGDMDKVRAQAITGQVDLVVRDDAALQKLPPSLRPAMPQAPSMKREVEMTTGGQDQPVKKDEAKK